MKLDDLREELRATEATATKTMTLRIGALRADGLRATRRAMGRLHAYLWLELGLNLVAAIWLGGFMASHLEARFLVAALALHVFAVGHVTFSARQLVILRRIDFGAPVVGVQRALERLRIGRIGMTKWTVLLSPLLWIPLLVVTLEGFLGIDTYAVFDRSWLVANVAFGVAFVPVMLGVSKWLADRVDGSPLLRHILRDIAGRNLRAARAFIDELGRFETGEGG